MQVPLEIAFRNTGPSEAIKAEIEEEARWLEKFYGRITSCQVTVTAPNGHHRHGIPYKISLRIAMPDRKDIIVNATHDDKKEQEYPTVAIKRAFAAARRQIEDAVREMRGVVKPHPPEDHGRVSKFVADQDYGFIETPDGREVYFHRNSVLDGAFDRLNVGSEVRFVEEIGAKGPQASTVRPVGKHHLV
ncbi:MAG TPA: HPF/RaiA family ribosome-associated protein [Methylovirgula sp.]|nr:HPF/RaiA family ribosome-associated protein [Methylovirgula sp.]